MKHLRLDSMKEMFESYLKLFSAVTSQGHQSVPQRRILHLTTNYTVVQIPEPGAST